MYRCVVCEFLMLRKYTACTLQHDSSVIAVILIFVSVNSEWRLLLSLSLFHVSLVNLFVCGVSFFVSVMWFLMFRIKWMHLCYFCVVHIAYWRNHGGTSLIRDLMCKIIYWTVTSTRLNIIMIISKQSYEKCLSNYLMEIIRVFPQKKEVFLAHCRAISNLWGASS